MPGGYAARSSVARIMVGNNPTPTYAFIVQTNSEPDSTIVDAVYGACDDATTSIDGGRLSIAFDREAETLERAIRSAVDTLRTLHIDVAAVTLDVDSLAVLN